ncbi:MAG: hypothetical protein JO079_03780 [Frankiaceae bacterium]|nr:hypothetical protein [Frankiaceae bacterium]
MLTVIVGVLVGLISPASPAGAVSTVADSATAVWTGNVQSSCIFLSSDDAGDVCGPIAFTAQTCHQFGEGAWACVYDGTLAEPDGDTVTFSVSGDGVAAGIIVSAAVITLTGTVTDDGATWAAAGQASGLGCIDACTFPSTLTLSW